MVRSLHALELTAPGSLKKKFLKPGDLVVMPIICSETGILLSPLSSHLRRKF